MNEFSTEGPQAVGEVDQTIKAAKQKLKDLYGYRKVEPAILGFTTEQVKVAYEKFGERVKRETDLDKVVEGIMPLGALLNPDVLRSIDTASGLVKIKKIGIMRAVFSDVLLDQRPDSFDESRMKIRTLSSDLDPFSTMVCIANEQLPGAALAHEATHAHQGSGRKITNQMIADATHRAGFEMQRIYPELSYREAFRLCFVSRDEDILKETQAHILLYSITGGDAPHDEVATLKANLAKARRGELKPSDIEKSDPGITPLNDTQKEAWLQTKEREEYDDIPLSRYSENGYASILDLVANSVKVYLPKMDRDNEKYLSRIQTATFQIIRLLNHGISHRQIADLIRNNIASIRGESVWDEVSKKYKFLEFPAGHNQGREDDNRLLERFNKQTESRVMRLRSIATEELTVNKTSN